MHATERKPRKARQTPRTAPPSTKPATPLPSTKPLGRDAIEMVFEKKRSERRAAIDELVAEAKAKGRPSERIVAAIIYDSEKAPMSTNRKQLSEIGIEVPPPEALADEDITTALKTLIDGLAMLGIFLTGTDHLDDRRLYTQLATKVIEEEIRDVPPNADMSEFIDLSACVPPGVQEDGADEQQADDDGIKPKWKKIADRDRTLPRPERGGIDRGIDRGAA
jgi:ferritin-like protein